MALPPGFVYEDELPAGFVYEDDLPEGFVYEEEQQAPQEAPQPNFLKRSLSTLQQGLSDSMSTMAGDSFGRSGDPTERDFQNKGVYETTGRRLVKALGGDIIPAAGGVASDALISAGKAVLSPSQQEAIGSGVQTVMESEPVQYATEKLGELEEAYPEAYATGSELLNIGAALSPLKGPRIKGASTVGDTAKKRLKNTVDRERMARTQKSLEPDNIFQAGDVDVTPSGTYRPVAKDWETRMYKEVESVPDYDPFQNTGLNIKAIDDQVDVLRNQLDAGLPDNLRIKNDFLVTRIDDTLDRLQKQPMLGRDAKDAANEVMQIFEEILAPLRQSDGSVRPIDLLDARRALDKRLTSMKKGIYGDAVTGSSVAAKEIRRTVNDIVDEVSPNAEVKSLLSRQSDLLEANSILRPRADKQSRTAFGRAIEKVEADTGGQPPRTGLSFKANVVDPLSAAIIGGSTAASLGARGVRNAARAGDVAAAQGLQGILNSRTYADAIRKSMTVPQRAALLAATNDEEENY